MVLVFDDCVIQKLRMDVANVWMTGSGNKSEISSIKHRQVIADSVSPQRRQDPDFMDRQVRLGAYCFPLSADK